MGDGGLNPQPCQKYISPLSEMKRGKRRVEGESEVEIVSLWLSQSQSTVTNIYVFIESKTRFVCTKYLLLEGIELSI